MSFSKSDTAFKCLKSLPALATIAPVLALLFPIGYFTVSRTPKLSHRPYYNNYYPSSHIYTHDAHLFITDILKQALNKSSSNVHTVTINKGITNEAALRNYGYLHNDTPPNQFCPPMNTPYKPACLTTITNSYFGTCGTAIQPSSQTVYELGGGCCIWDWNLYLNKTVRLPNTRPYQGNVVMVLNGHHSVTYHHVLHDVIPRYLMFARLLDAFPEILVAVDHGGIAVDVLDMLGFPRDRVIIMKGSGEQWLFASVLLYPPTVFGHKRLWFGKSVQTSTARIISAAVENDDAEKIVVLLERAVRRGKNGSCTEQRCTRNFDVLQRALQKLFKGVLKMIVHKAGDSVRTGVKLFSRARLVVGVHGGGFQNIMFCSPGTVVVHVGWGSHYKDVAELFDLKYYLSEMKELTRESRGIELNVKRVVVDVEKAARAEGILK